MTSAERHGLEWMELFALERLNATQVEQHVDDHVRAAIEWIHKQLAIDTRRRNKRGIDRSPP